MSSVWVVVKMSYKDDGEVASAHPVKAFDNEARANEYAVKQSEEWGNWFSFHVDEVEVSS